MCALMFLIGFLLGMIFISDALSNPKSKLDDILDDYNKKKGVI